MLLAALAIVAVCQVDAQLPQRVMAGVTADHCRADIEKLVSFGTRHSLSDTESPTRGIGAARRWIKSEFDAISAQNGGRLKASFEEFDVPQGPRMPRDAHLVNVVAVLPGTDPGQAGRRYYVVGHYDTRNGDGNDAVGDAPGANDDGSGTTVVIECARALAAHEFPATIVFLCTVAEEQGLYGAKYHADQAKARGDRILGVLSNDIVGDPLGPKDRRTKQERAVAAAKEQGGIPLLGEVLLKESPEPIVRVFSEGIPRNATTEQLAQIRSLAAESDSPSRQLARYVAEVAALERTAIQPKLVFRLDRFLRGGDHSMFNDNGFAAIRFTAPEEEYSRQHQNVRVEGGRHFGDTADYCDFDYIASVARLNAATLVHLASAPAGPANVRVITAQLSNSTTIRWDASPGASGYEVVWRDTTAPQWTNARLVEIASEATLELSKDDVIFGVRSVGTTGFKSPVVPAGSGVR